MTLKTILPLAVGIAAVCLAFFIKGKPSQNQPSLDQAPSTLRPGAFHETEHDEVIDISQVRPESPGGADGTEDEPDEVRNDRHPHLADEGVHVIHLEDFQPARTAGGERVREQFSSEAVDSAWATDTEYRLLQAIADAMGNVGASYIEVQCRTITCRIQLLLPGGTASERDGDVSVAAAQHGGALATTILGNRDLGLRVLSFSSGFDDHGVPTLLLYAQRQSLPSE